MKIILVTLSLLFCACSSPTSNSHIQVGNKTHKIISNAEVIKNKDRVDAVVYWHQRSDDAIIRVTHNNERKEGKFFIPNLASGLSKLIKKRNKVIIMVLDKDMMQHSRTKTLLNSLSDNTQVYISYFPEQGTQQ